MSYTSEQYKYLLLKRLQRHFSMGNAYDRAYTQSFFWELFDDSVTVTEEAYQNFCRLMDDELALCAEKGWYTCNSIPQKDIKEHGLLLTKAFAEIGVTLKIGFPSIEEGTATFTKPNGAVMVYTVSPGNSAGFNYFYINARAGTEYQYAAASAPAYNMQGMDVPEELGNPKIAGPGTYWSYNAGTKTVTVSGDGAYAGAAKDEQLGSGLYHTVILGANVSRLLRECVIPGASALVLLRPSDAGFAVDPQFNRSEKLDVYTDWHRSHRSDESGGKAGEHHAAQLVGVERIGKGALGARYAPSLY